LIVSSPDCTHRGIKLTFVIFQGLIGRLLYKIRSLSEHSAFDAATFSLIWPLLHHVIEKGGIGTESEDDAVEQLVLALDVIRSHSNQCQFQFLFLIPLSNRRQSTTCDIHGGSFARTWSNSSLTSRRCQEMLFQLS
jgi:hypothetical protein